MISITIFIIQLKSCIERSVLYSPGIHTRWRGYSHVGEIWWCHVTRCLRLDPVQSITEYITIKQKFQIQYGCIAFLFDTVWSIICTSRIFFLLFLYFSLFSKQDLQVFCCKLKCSLTPSLPMYVLVRENSLVFRKEDPHAWLQLHHLSISFDFVFCNINLL